MDISEGNRRSYYSLGINSHISRLTQNKRIFDKIWNGNGNRHKSVFDQMVKRKKVKLTHITFILFYFKF